MHKLIPFLLALMPLCVVAQNNTTDQQYIEVIGTAEMEVTPNEIFIEFYLSEYEKDRVLQTIEMQETALTKELQAAGLNLNEINVKDFESNYVRVEWGKRDYRQEKRYDFKVKTIQETAKVFEVFEKLEIRNSRITRIDHSDRKKNENDMRIEATKNAKSIANGMLEAIGQKTGKAIYVSESNRYLETVDARQLNRLAGVRYDMDQVSTLKGGEIIQYGKITIKSSVLARFEIL